MLSLAWKDWERKASNFPPEVAFQLYSFHCLDPRACPPDFLTRGEGGGQGPGKRWSRDRKILPDSGSIPAYIKIAVENQGGARNNN